MSDTKTKITRFFTNYPIKTFAKHEIIVRAGEDFPSVFYIIEGRVSQYDITPTGNEVVVNVFKPGAFFSMSAAINNLPNQYFFEASTEVTTTAVPKPDAVQFLQDNPDVLFDLLARVYRGTDGVLRRMTHLMGGDSKSRLLFELLNAAYRFGDTLHDGSTQMSLHEGDIARHSGLARETVSRILRGLKDAGFVKVDRHGITITNIREVEKMLDNTF